MRFRLLENVRNKDEYVVLISLERSAVHYYIRFNNYTQLLYYVLRLSFSFKILRITHFCRNRTEVERSPPLLLSPHIFENS